MVSSVARSIYNIYDSQCTLMPATWMQASKRAIPMFPAVEVFDRWQVFELPASPMSLRCRPVGRWAVDAGPWTQDDRGTVGTRCTALRGFAPLREPSFWTVGAVMSVDKHSSSFEHAATHPQVEPGICHFALLPLDFSLCLPHSLRPSPCASPTSLPSPCSSDR